MGIPIVIGVTGHRDLRGQDIPRLKEIVTAELKKLLKQYPHTEFVMLNSIASGADTLCANAALELGMKLVCSLPLPACEYRKDFSQPDAEVFDALLQKAADVFVAPDTEPAPQAPTRDFHYRQAGIYVASHSHVLLALWDGSSAKINGCGTAEVVDFMLKGDYAGGGCFKAANDAAVIHVYTPRLETATPVCARLIENEPGSMGKHLN